MKSFKEYNKKDNPFLDWKSSFGEIRKKSPIKEAIDPNQEVLKHIGTSGNPSQVVAYDEIHNHPDIKSSSGFDQDQLETISHYSNADPEKANGDESSRNMNAFLRHRMGKFDSKITGRHSPNDVMMSVFRLSSLFQPHHTNKKPIETFTGVPNHLGKKLSQMSPGDETHLPGFTSTSTDKEEARKFSHNYRRGIHDSNERHLIRFHVHPGAGLSVARHSVHPNENEILLNHGTKTTYLGKTEENINGINYTIHHMEAHPESLEMRQYPHDYDHNR